MSTQEQILWLIWGAASFFLAVLFTMWLGARDVPALTAMGVL